MNKRALLLTSMLIMALQTFSQKAGYYFSVKPHIGYAFNLLNAPMTYVPSEGTPMVRQQLWKSSPVVGSSMRLMTYSWHKIHTITLDFNYQEAFLKPDQSIESSAAGASIEYRYKNLRKLTNSLRYSIKNYVRTGVDEDNLLGVPLSYKSMSLSNEVYLKLNKRVHLSLKPFSELKNYQRENYDRFYFFDYGLNVTVNYKYKIKRKMGYMLYATTHQRHYVVETEDVSNSELSQNRLWRYYSAGVGNKIPLGKKAKILTRVGYTHRSDQLQDKFGYNQFITQAGLHVKAKSVKGSLTAAYFNRFYTDFLFRANGQDRLLNYRYIKCSGDLKFRLGEHFDIFVAADTKLRLSNANNVANRTMRSYFISQFKVGTVIKFRGKYRHRIKMAIF